MLDHHTDLAPATADELAAAVADANHRGATLVPVGAGTRMHIGAAPQPGAELLSTVALARVLEHVPADMTVAVEAGISLGVLQRTLREHGQWLPWEPPAPPEATVGGLLATAASGPLRLAYGSPRDWVLGMRAVLGDGRLVKSGGKVVKNVAGYDSHKLHIGALGTLGVIAEVTFKVFPLPEDTLTLLAAAPDVTAALRLAEAMRARPLAPASLCILDAPELLPEAPHVGVAVVARYAGVRPAVERQTDAAAAAAQEAGAAVDVLGASESEALWARIATFSAPRASVQGAQGGEIVLRAGAAPSALGGVLAALRENAPAGAATAGYPGVGVAFARWASDGPDLVAALGRLRRAVGQHGGYVAVENAPGSLRAALELWGPPPATLPLMRALKRQWDPNDVLNRGRYLV